MKNKSFFRPVAVIAMLLVMIAAIPFSTAQKIQETKLPSIAPLSAKLESLVREYYPDASLTISSQSIHFEYRARDLMVHESSANGDWQDARKERGPNRKGVVCDLALYPGEYENLQQGVNSPNPKGVVRDFTLHPGKYKNSQIHDKPYYRELHFITASSIHNYLGVLLRVPTDASPEFIEKFDNIISKYGDYLKPSN